MMKKFLILINKSYISFKGKWLKLLDFFIMLKLYLKKFYIQLKINNLLIIFLIFLFMFIIIFFFDLSSFFSLNVVIPENPEHNRIVLPNEIFDFNVLKKDAKIILPMRPEYPTTIIITETFSPHKIISITYMELLDFFYNEMLTNDNFFKTDLTIIELYEIVVASDVNYFYDYYYYYLFCYKLFDIKEFFRLTIYLKFDRFPTIISLLRDKFLVQRKRKILFFVLKQGLDLITLVKKEKEKEKEKEKKKKKKK